MTNYLTRGPLRAGEIDFDSQSEGMQFLTVEDTVLTHGVVSYLKSGVREFGPRRVWGIRWMIPSCQQPASSTNGLLLKGPSPPKNVPSFETKYSDHLLKAFYIWAVSRYTWQEVVSAKNSSPGHSPKQGRKKNVVILLCLSLKSLPKDSKGINSN